MTPPYFPYNRVLLEAETELRDRGSILLVGGRGLGKTTLASVLAGRAGVAVLAGRDPASARHLQALVDAADLPALLVVDDLHELVRNHDGEVAFSGAIVSRVGAPTSCQVLATTTRPAHELLERLSPGGASDFVTRAAKIQVDPWHINWRAAVERGVRQVTSQPHPVVVAWSEAIADTSGGHPSLVGAALTRLKALLLVARTDGAVEDLSEAEKRLLDPETCTRDVVGAWLARELIGSGLPTLLRAVDALRSEHVESWGALLDLARGAPRDVPTVVAWRLRTFGLAFEEDGAVRIAGSVLADHLRQQISPPAAPAPAPVPTAPPRPAGPELGIQEQRLFDALATADPPSLRSRGELITALGGVTPKALDNILHRLRTALRATEGWPPGEDPIPSLRGRGYRLHPRLRRHSG